MNDDRGTGDPALTDAKGGGPPDDANGDGGEGPEMAGGSGIILPDGSSPSTQDGKPGMTGTAPAAAASGGTPGVAGTAEPRVSGRASDAARRRAALAAARRKRRRKASWWIELLVLFAFALLLMLVIKTYVVQAFYIPSSSMENTLEIGDKVLVNKLVYHFRSVDRGDIVVFNGEGSWNPAPPPPSSDPVVRAASRFGHAVVGLFGISPGVHDYIKRVVGVPGDRVACCDARGRITVNGVPLNEKSYLYPDNPPSTTRFSITVPPGRLWVMGDHRSVSYDSRGHSGDPGGGTIPESQVVGRAFVIMWPPSRAGILSIPSTFGQPRLTGAAASALTAPGASLLLAGALVLPFSWLRWRARRRERLRRGVRLRLRRRPDPRRGPQQDRGPGPRSRRRLRRPGRW